jgi:drug/metabolite transporter (DMT)-like permease
VLSVPFVALPTLLAAQHNQAVPGAAAWFGFGYLCLVSQLVGFFAWYHGLAIGGVARVSQMQLFQPFLTLMFSAVILRESITPMTLGAAALVIGCVAIGRSAKIRRRDQDGL